MFCSTYTAYFYCVLNNTKGCNQMAMIPVNMKHAEIRQKLAASGNDCPIPEFEMPESELLPLRRCSAQFLGGFIGGILEGFIPRGNAGEVCRAANDFRFVAEIVFLSVLIDIILSNVQNMVYG